MPIMIDSAENDHLVSFTKEISNMRRAKISIIGGGNVGASCALWAAEKELGDIEGDFV